MSWREKIKKRFGIKSEHEDLPDLQLSEVKEQKKSQEKILPKLEIHLGIDFGTAWSKICYRNLEEEYSGDVYFVSDDGKLSPFCETVIYTDGESGLISMCPFEKSSTIQKRQLHFKMKLSPDDERNIAFYYSVFYLARTINKAKKTIKASIFNLDAEYFWTASIGMPTSYKGAKLEKVYRSLARLAWALSEEDLPDTFKLKEWKILCTEKEMYLETVQDHTVDIVPELQGNIFSLTQVKARPNGIYALFDIGGGTLDGSLFQLQRSQGSRKVEILRALVDPLGVESISRIMKSNKEISPDQISEILSEGNEWNFHPKLKNEATDAVYTHVAQVLVSGKKASPNHESWRGEDLPLMLCGGGSELKWFQKAIPYTHTDRKLRNCGIPLLKLHPLPPLKEDFHYNVLKPEEMNRYLLAYGLSFPLEEHHEVLSYPHQNPVVEPKYRDTMAQQYNRLNDWYGEPYV